VVVSNFGLGIGLMGMSETRIFQKKKNQDHRTIAKELDWYILDEKAGQGLPLLLPN